MKKFTLLCIGLFGLLWASGQTISGQAFVQQTAMGMQKGYGIRYQTQKGHGLGFVIQSSGKYGVELQGENYPFYGIEGVLPVTTCGYIRVFFTPKIGFVNQNYLVAIPEIETEMKITRNLTFAITTGIRARESSAGAKAIIHF